MRSYASPKKVEWTARCAEGHELRRMAAPEELTSQGALFDLFPCPGCQAYVLPSRWEPTCARYSFGRPTV